MDQFTGRISVEPDSRPTIRYPSSSTAPRYDRLPTMGLFDRFSRSAKPPTEPTREQPVFTAVTLDVELVGPSVEGLVKLAGTTTFAKEAVAAMLDRHVQGDAGMLIIDGALHREPHNPADSNAVAVHVEGERIGCLPGYVAQLVNLSAGASRPVPVQFFYVKQGNGAWRGEAWSWLSSGEPQWQFTEQAPPPMTAAERRKANAASTDKMIEEAVAGGGARAAQFTDAAVNGIHYLQTVEPIQELKRQGRLDEALALCYLAIEGAERARGEGSPAPWYTEQAAIIHRKLGQRSEEIAVLQRWLKATPSGQRNGSSIAERLSKLTAG